MILFFAELKQASQCLKEEGMTFLSLYCGFRRTISIHGAVHGAHTDGSTDCLPMDGDCREDRQDVYDWSQCEGKHNCVLMLKPKTVPQCGGEDSLGYIQVDYACVPGTGLQTSL